MMRGACLKQKHAFSWGYALSVTDRYDLNRNEAGENGKALVEGPPGDVTLVQLNIHTGQDRGQQVLDVGDG